MCKKLMFLVSLVVLLGTINSALAKTEIELKVDLAYDRTFAVDSLGEDEAQAQARYEGTAKEGWIHWENNALADLNRHDERTFVDVGGTGIDATVTVGREGDLTMCVLGLEWKGDSVVATGTPEGDPIANSYVLSWRHWGAGQSNRDGSVILTFTNIPPGEYELTSYHSDADNPKEHGNGYPSRIPDGNDIMPFILVTGDGVIQIHDEETVDINVPIQHVASDDELVPSLVKFEADGSGPVEIEYATPPGDDGAQGGAAVLNAFILYGSLGPRAFGPSPSNGATDVHPDVVLSWMTGAMAASHDVYFGDSLNDVNNGIGGTFMGNQETNSYDAGRLDLGTTYYWRIDEVNDVNDDSPWKGIVWKFTILDGKATDPSPINGETDVPLEVLLSWSPGPLADSHDVYFGDDFDDVKDANTSSPEYKGRQDANDSNYAVPGLLELDTTYCWRIDEVNSIYGDSKGTIWSFTTLQYLVVDDMESYDLAANEIQDTWIDGWVNYTGSEVALGSATVFPPRPVHDGNQSMEFMYDNGGSYGLDYYSEAERTFDDPCDWTVLGAKALVLYFYGDPNNDADVTEQMYVALEDSAGHTGMVLYDGDLDDIKKQQWQEWNIDLQDPCLVAANVNVKSIKKVYIGVGIRGNPNPDGIPGGVGKVYFDDIRLYLPRCVPSMLQLPRADFNRDCIVDFKDLKVMADDWLLVSSEAVEIVAPDANELVVEYTFDTDYNDTSGNDYHGIPAIGTSISDGKLILTGALNSYVEIPLGEDNPFGGMHDYSIQITFSSTDGQQPLLSSCLLYPGDDEDPLIVHTQDDGRLGVRCANLASADGILNFNDGAMHCAVVVNKTALSTFFFYSDGLDDGNARLGCMPPGVEQNVVRIGSILPDENFEWMELSDNFTGQIDSIRIYNYALSKSEAVYLATDGTGILPLRSAANLYDKEPPASQAVNFRDYAELADSWLVRVLWP